MAVTRRSQLTSYSTLGQVNTWMSDSLHSRMERVCRFHVGDQRHLCCRTKNGLSEPPHITHQSHIIDLPPTVFGYREGSGGGSERGLKLRPYDYSPTCGVPQIVTFRIWRNRTASVEKVEYIVYRRLVKYSPRITRKNQRNASSISAAGAF